MRRCWFFRWIWKRNLKVVFRLRNDIRYMASMRVYVYPLSTKLIISFILLYFNFFSKGIFIMSIIRFFNKINSLLNCVYYIRRLIIFYIFKKKFQQSLFHSLHICYINVPPFRHVIFFFPKRGTGSRTQVARFKV